MHMAALYPVQEEMVRICNIITSAISSDKLMYMYTHMYIRTYLNNCYKLHTYVSMYSPKMIKIFDSYPTVFTHTIICMYILVYGVLDMYVSFVHMYSCLLLAPYPVLAWICLTMYVRTYVSQLSSVHTKHACTYISAYICVLSE